MPGCVDRAVNGKTCVCTPPASFLRLHRFFGRSGLGNFVKLPDLAILALLAMGLVGAVLTFRYGLRFAVFLSIAALALGIIRASDFRQLWADERADFLRVSKADSPEISALVAKRDLQADSAVYELEDIIVRNIRNGEQFFAGKATWSFLFTGGEIFRAGDRIILKGAKLILPLLTNHFYAVTELRALSFFRVKSCAKLTPVQPNWAWR